MWLIQNIYFTFSTPFALICTAILLACTIKDTINSIS